MSQGEEKFQISKKIAKVLLKDKNTPATVLLAIVLDGIGSSVFDWYPTTIYYEIRDTWGVKIPQTNLSKIYSTILYFKRSEEFYHSTPFFLDITLGLNGHLMQNLVWYPPTPEEVLWTAFETFALSLEEFTKVNRFSEEIQAFVNILFKKHGFKRLPKIALELGFIEQTVKNLPGEEGPSSLLTLNITSQESLEYSITIDLISKVLEYINYLEKLNLLPGSIKVRQILEPKIHSYYNLVKLYR